MTKTLSVLVATIAGAGLPAAPAAADEARVEAVLSGTNVVPPIETAATGQVQAVLNTESNEVVWFIDYRGLSGPATAIRLHGPAAAGENAGAVVSPTAAPARPINGGTTLSSAVAELFLAGQLYLVVVTAAHPEGELRAQLTITEIEKGAGSSD
jgi:hypothetical protein